MIFRNFKGMVVTGGLAGALFGVNLILGGGLSWAFGMFGLSGLVTGLPIGFTFYLASRMTRSFGCITLLWTLYSFFAIPTPLMGPPVPHKVLIGFAGGLAYDLVLWVFRRKTFSYYLAFIAYISTMIALFMWMFVGTDLDPYAQQLADTLKLVIQVVFISAGLLSTWVADKWWKRHIAGTELEFKFVSDPDEVARP